MGLQISLWTPGISREDLEMALGPLLLSPEIAHIHELILAVMFRQGECIFFIEAVVLWSLRSVQVSL